MAWEVHAVHSHGMQDSVSAYKHTCGVAVT